MVIFAWALMSNHAHLLVRSASAGLPTFMRKMLTGCSVSFNKRHQRTGHLFQNRYKSILCEEEAYFVYLSEYIESGIGQFTGRAGALSVERPCGGHGQRCSCMAGYGLCVAAVWQCSSIGPESL
jgi:hypothetical protein